MVDGQQVPRMDQRAWRGQRGASLGGFLRHMDPLINLMLIKLLRLVQGLLYHCRDIKQAPFRTRRAGQHDRRRESRGAIGVAPGRDGNGRQIAIIAKGHRRRSAPW